MSDKKKEGTTQVSQEPQEKAYDPNELVEYTAPLLPGGNQPDIYGGVNGETFRVKRGVKVMIKRKFLDALMNAQEQQLEAYRARVQMQKAGNKSSGEM